MNIKIRVLVQFFLGMAYSKDSRTVILVPVCRWDWDQENTQDQKTQEGGQEKCK
jgi:hypothetical protein